MTVTSCFGAARTIPRIAADSSPERSATPTPSRATSTVPSGTKPVKLVTSDSTIQRKPSADIRLNTSIRPDSARPAAPGGRGSATDTPSARATPDSTTTPAANRAKSVTGCGRRLPSHSTTPRNRANQPLVGRSGGAATGFSGTGGCSGMRTEYRRSGRGGAAAGRCVGDPPRAAPARGRQPPTRRGVRRRATKPPPALDAIPKICGRSGARAASPPARRPPGIGIDLPARGTRV